LEQQQASQNGAAVRLRFVCGTCLMLGNFSVNLYCMQANHVRDDEIFGMKTELFSIIHWPHPQL
jgi:hypothetical protein